MKETQGDTNKQQGFSQPRILKVNDRTKILGEIPKPGRDFVDCCYTSCTRC